MTPTPTSKFSGWSIECSRLSPSTWPFPRSTTSCCALPKVNHAPDTVKHLCHYLCELALLDDVPYLHFLPSIVAGSALCLENHTLRRHPWGQELVEYSGYEVTAFRECIHSLYSSFCSAPSRPQRAVHDKFKTPK
ncbi:hypothetical protein HPB48_021399 [Haemaphysalis longicornis]|uniref:Cyclin C-terminal domain-containing protein n=1 Tax=Haemaphysalis longicornis TaxID=44386 RepID=A0A9J6GLT6_HAELO|nr:hypothetical protein HPB48_021399 [Haemaphysalis longicornis]